MKALGYIRVSTDGQEDGTSLESQEQSIRAYCVSRNIDLGEIFRDVASGKDFHRPGFQEMRTKLEENGFDAVIVNKYDRLSRSPVDGRQFTDLLEQKEKSLISVQDQIDTSTPIGKACFTMMLTFAEMERAIITERLSTGRETRAKQGRKPSSYNYGFTRDDKSNMVAVENEIEVVKDIFRLYRDHESVQKVVDRLNESNVSTRRGGRWTVKSVYNILVNPVYIGKIRWKGEIIKGIHDPIVSTRVFNHVGRQLVANRKR